MRCAGGTPCRGMGNRWNPRVGPVGHRRQRAERHGVGVVQDREHAAVGRRCQKGPRLTGPQVGGEIGELLVGERVAIRRHGRPLDPERDRPHEVQGPRASAKGTAPQVVGPRRPPIVGPERLRGRPVAGALAPVALAAPGALPHEASPRRVARERGRRQRHGRRGRPRRAREGDHAVRERADLRGGQGPFPRGHPGPRHPARDRALEVLDEGRRPGDGRPELERAPREVPRRRIEERRGRPAPVPELAVARKAEPPVEPRGRIDGVVGARHRDGGAERHDDGGEEQRAAHGLRARV